DIPVDRQDLRSQVGPVGHHKLGAMILLSEEVGLEAMGTDFTGWWFARMGGYRPVRDVQA
ncbi:hypothetical protein JKG47_22715, partial [Acidithiobacillus sp. MC6.1]|nr:hypothetical protein [Acidithiobacillus sp. MC6.1]